MKCFWPWRNKETTVFENFQRVVTIELRTEELRLSVVPKAVFLIMGKLVANSIGLVFSYCYIWLKVDNILFGVLYMLPIIVVFKQ